MGIRENISLQVRIVELQAELKKANARIAELENSRIQYVDNPELVSQILSLQEKLRAANG